MTSRDHPVRFRRRSEVLWRRSADIVLAIPADGTVHLALSPAASALWELLETPQTSDELAAVLRLDRSADLEPALDDLVGRGLAEAIG